MRRGLAVAVFAAAVVALRRRGTTLTSVNIRPTPLAGAIVMRLLEESDAGPLSEAYLLNREYLQPWEPRRADADFTLAGQRSRVQDQLRLLESGQTLPWVLDEGGRVVGTLTLSNVVLGPFRSANIGYWIDHGYAGRGLATQAVAHACRLADEVADLHRLEAGTHVRNTGSQRVLTKAGFTRIGTAPNYLHVDGAWQDHLIYQRILNERPPACGRVQDRQTVGGPSDRSDGPGRV